MPAAAHHHLDQQPREEVVLEVLERAREAGGPGRRPARLLDEVVEVLAGRGSGLVRVVGGREADGEEGGGHRAEAGGVAARPVDDLALVVARGDGGAGQDGGVVGGKGSDLASARRTSTGVPARSSTSAMREAI